MTRHISLAALALLSVLAFASMANACQLVCGVTKATYTGNMGGLAAADANCVTEFGTGFKFARSSAFLASLPGVVNPSQGGALGDSAVGSQYHWVNSNPAYGSNCTNWGSTAGSGPSVIVSNGYVAGSSGASCSGSRALVCCNM